MQGELKSTGSICHEHKHHMEGTRKRNKFLNFVGVMRQGEIVEWGTIAKVINNPQH